MTIDPVGKFVGRAITKAAATMHQAISPITMFGHRISNKALAPGRRGLFRNNGREMLNRPRLDQVDVKSVWPGGSLVNSGRRHLLFYGYVCSKLFNFRLHLVASSDRRHIGIPSLGPQWKHRVSTSNQALVMHFVKPRDDAVDEDFLRILKEKKIGIVVPCHNERKNITIVTRTLPDYVDAIVVIDDKSTDDTAAVVEQEAEQDDRIVLIRHEANQGVGGAIATGYQWCRDNDVDAAVVMAGDAQMDPAELPILLRPLLVDGVNYTKGNRLIYQQARYIIPGIRFFGNAILSLLTKFASGYWHVADSQCGYTAADRKVLKRVDWRQMYKSYGQPNDLLVTLNIQNFRVRDVPIRPVYNVGEVSGICIRRVIFTISNILLRRGLQRLWLKYVVYDFHPLILFFSFGCIMGAAALLFFLSVVVNWIDDGHAPMLSTLAFLFSVSFSVNSFFFSMWMDMERNKHLR